jgi:thioesterase domain-containing protein
MSIARSGIGQWGPTSFETRRVVRLNSAGAGPDVYCLHSASGQTKVYKELADVLDGTIGIVGLEAAGLRGDCPPHRSVEEMADDYLSLIESHGARYPYHFMGYSTGGLIAYEMAQKTVQKGNEVAFLGLIDTALRPETRAKDIAPDDWIERGKWLVFWRVLFRWVDRSIWADDHPFWKMSDEGRLHNIAGRLKSESQSALWSSAKPEEVDRYYVFFSAHWTALRVLYSPQPYAGHLTFLAATINPDTASLGLWEQLARSCAVAQLPGEHYALMEGSNVIDLAQRLTAILAPSASRRQGSA